MLNWLKKFFDFNKDGVVSVHDARFAAEAAEVSIKEANEKINKGIAEVKAEVNERVKRVKEEVADVKKAAKEVANQAGDVVAAAKGKNRAGRKKK